MQWNKKYAGIFFLFGFSIIFFAAGCRTRREVVLERTRVSNMTFERDLMTDDLRLDEMESASFVLLNKTRHQSQHLLQLAPDAELKERYHRAHDMTIFGVSGQAIVEVEGKRHIMQPGDAVFIPRMFNYSVTAHESPGNVIAVMVYSPPFDGS